MIAKHRGCAMCIMEFADAPINKFATFHNNIKISDDKIYEEEECE